MAEKEDYTKDKGDTGDTGPIGEQGEPGEQGDTGPPGTTDYEELDNVPATFAPSAHITDHLEGGGDANGLAAQMIKYAIIFGD